MIYARSSGSNINVTVRRRWVVIGVIVWFTLPAVMVSIVAQVFVLSALELRIMKRLENDVALSVSLVECQSERLALKEIYKDTTQENAQWK